MDLALLVFYGEAKDTKKWRDLESNRAPVIYAKGMVEMLSGSSFYDIFFHANEIVYVMDKRD